MQNLAIAKEFGLIVYLIIFLIHVAWAAVLHVRGLADLSVGPVRGTGPIFFALVLLNLPSAMVFLPGSSMASPAWAAGHAMYHMALSIDEIPRTKKSPVRAVFLFNHIYWSLILAGFAWGG